jgi:hypothetical protein
MRSNIVCLTLSAAIGCLLAGVTAHGEERMLAHDVYFSLTDKSPEARTKLIAGCKKYLAGHPGTAWFAAGALATEFQREVNDRDFDVALHVVFKDKAAHDVYQESERHEKFIEEFRGMWAKVRVFDSYVDVSDHADMPAKPAGNK